MAFLLPLPVPDPHLLQYTRALMTIERLLYRAAYLYDGPYTGRKGHQKACFLVHQVQEDYQATDTAPHNCGGNEPSATETSWSVGYYRHTMPQNWKGNGNHGVHPQLPELCAGGGPIFFQCLCDRKLRCGKLQAFALQGKIPT